MCAIFVILFASAFFFVESKIPNYIHVCNSSDPNISRCIADTIEKLKPKLRAGIPELDVPPLEPLLLDTIKLRSAVQSNITDLKVLGSSSFEILEIKANIPQDKFYFKVRIPKLQFSGNYELDMRVLFISLKGRGPIYGNFSNYVAEGLMQGNKITINGKEYLKFDKMKIKVRLGGSSLRLENLFNGDPILGDVTNELINENVDLFLGEIKPTLENALAEKFTDISNKITLKFTYDELFKG